MHAVLLRNPDCEAVVFNGSRITYMELAARACSLRNQLRDLGVQPGDRVAVLVTPRPEALVSLLAVWLAGATWVGVNTRYKFEEQRQILSDSNAGVLISMTQSDNRDLVPDIIRHEAAGVQSISIGAGLWEGDLPPPCPRSSVSPDWGAALDTTNFETPAVVIYTSGSTGQPKGALITHAGLAFRSQTMLEDRFDNIRIRLLLDLPVNHIGALASEIGLAIVSGGLMVVAEKFDAGFTLAAIEREQLNAVFGVPAMLTHIAEHPRFATTDFGSLKYLCWGAGPLGEAVIDRFLRASDALFSQQYGMTESNGPIVYTPPTRDREILRDTTGKPDPRLEVRVANESDLEVAPGEEGEVQVRMPFPYAGYLNNPAATAESQTLDGFLRTGDLARIREDGFLVFCGRTKEMYKSGGFNVYPREIEIALELHPAIRAAAVIGREDPKWGQVGVAFVEPNSKLNIAGVEDWCRGRLADYKIPKEIKIVEALPRTPLDKVDRVELAKWISSGVVPRTTSSTVDAAPVSRRRGGS